jgi:hypothetical protein
LLAIAYVLSANSNSAVSGKGKMKFKVLYKSDHLPPDAKKVSKALTADSLWVCEGQERTTSR